jgi:hypothetical protein
MRAKYELIGEELSIHTAAAQAAYALDSSATIAEQQRDQAGLLAVADSWMKLADFLAALRESEAKLPGEKKEKTPFGFSSKVDLTDGVSFDLQDDIEEEEFDVRDTDDED